MKRVGVAFALAPLLAGPASATIEIWGARIAEGDLWVLGRTDDANGPVTLDDSFTEQSDTRGRFEFRVPYHPASCIVLVKTRTESRMAVVGNCGQRGPQGEPGPAGPAAPPRDSSQAPAPPSGSDPALLRPTPGTPALPERVPNGEPMPACGARAAQYAAESGSKVWVVRRGRMSQQNPLRPTPGQSPAIVLQVTIDGRSAAAYGESFNSMLQGGPPDQLEQESGNPIEWLQTIDPLPDTIRIVSSGGGSVFARLQFEQCGTPPRVAPHPSRSAPRARSEGGGQAESGAGIPRGLGLPKGAIEALPRPR